jgi:hypothetical protein
MPFISTEDVKAKREQLKKEFPKYKFSITKENYSSISISILSGPVDLLPNKEKKYESVNQYYIDDNYKNNKFTRDLLNKIYDIANSKNYTVTEDADYGSVPKFYVNITIGKWNKPYLIIKK